MRSRLAARRRCSRPARGAPIPFVPGIATASEIMTGLELGYRCFKFFPAEQLGGVAALKALGAPLPQRTLLPDRRHQRRASPRLSRAGECRVRRRLVDHAGGKDARRRLGRRSKRWRARRRRSARAGRAARTRACPARRAARATPRRRETGRRDAREHVETLGRARHRFGQHFARKRREQHALPRIAVREKQIAAPADMRQARHA